MRSLVVLMFVWCRFVPVVCVFVLACASVFVSALLCASVFEHQKGNKQFYSEDPSARARASHRPPAAVWLADLAAGEEGDLADVVRDLADVDPVDVPVGRGEGLPLDDQRHGLRGLLRANTNNCLTRLRYKCNIHPKNAVDI